MAIKKNHQEQLEALKHYLGSPNPHRILIIGPAGTGKSHCSFIFDPNGTRTHRIPITKYTTGWDLKYQRDIKDGNTVTLLGPAARAFANPNQILVLDDIHNAEKPAMSELFGILDDASTAQVVLPESILKIPPGLVIIATSNESLSRLPEGIADRFDIILTANDPVAAAIAQLPASWQESIKNKYKHNSEKRIEFSREMTIRSLRAMHKFTTFGVSLEEAAELTHGTVYRDIITTISAAETGLSSSHYTKDTTEAEEAQAEADAAKEAEE